MPLRLGPAPRKGQRDEGIGRCFNCRRKYAHVKEYPDYKWYCGTCVYDLEGRLSIVEDTAEKGLTIVEDGGRLSLTDATEGG